MIWGNSVTYLGNTTLKEKDVRFGIKDEDRKRHLCVLGRVGSGRNTLMVNMALQDIERGVGVVVLDANGNFAPCLVERLSDGAKDRLIYVDPSEAEYPYSWNSLDDVRALDASVQEKALTQLIRSVYRVYDEPFTSVLVPRMLKNKDATLVTFYTVLTNERSRDRFFKDDEDGLSEIEALIQDNDGLIQDIDENGRYIGKDTLVRNVLGQHKSKFNLTSLKDGAIVVVDLSKIKMFPTRMTPVVRTFAGASHLLSKESHVPISLYLHDCLRYLGDTEIDDVFGAQSAVLTVSDTIIQEADKERREMALSKCGSIASFAAHPMDKGLVERAFYPYIEPEELTYLEDKELVVALTIDGVRSKPFFAKIPEMEGKKLNAFQDLILRSRREYTTSRVAIDAEYKMQRDEEKDGGGPPGGFHDAFKSIFAKRANGGNPPPKTEPPVKKPEPKKEVSKKQENKEIAESVLKQMIYVQPITS